MPGEATSQPSALSANASELGVSTVLIDVRNFMGITHARLKTNTRYAVIAGKNGCGKSRFLAAVVEGCSPEGTADLVETDAGIPPYHVTGGDRAGLRQIEVTPSPTSVLYVPAHRRVLHPLDEAMADRAGGYSTIDGAGLAFGTELRFGLLESRLVAWCALDQDYIDEDWAYPDEQLGYWSPLAWPDPSRGTADWRRLGDAYAQVTGWHLVVARLGEHFDSARMEGLTVAVTREDGPTLPVGMLSSGQKELLALLMDAFMCPAGGLLVVDELEQHIHPELQTKLLKQLCSLLPTDAFLLVSTHSPAILLGDGINSAWWMEEADPRKDRNQLQRIGSGVSLIMSVCGLYGSAELASVGEAFVSAYRLEFLQFIEQCCRPAAVEPMQHGHPQVGSIAETLTTLLTSKPGVFRFLDFGCGEGRSAMAFEGLPPEDLRRIHVTLVDPNEKRLGKAQRAWKTVIGGHELAGLTSHLDLTQLEELDYVVAANVFHEIRGEAFLQAFGSLWAKLTTNGYLHIVEYGELPRGETGFLMLTKAGFASFFTELQVANYSIRTVTVGRLEYVTVKVLRGDITSLSLVPEAYKVALEVTKADCLRILETKVKESLSRAFWLENLAAVSSALAEITLRNGAE